MSKRKIFHNAFGYSNEGWYICEWRDFPYAEDKEAHYIERDNIRQEIYSEFISVVKELNLNIMDFDGNPSTDLKMVFLNEEDGIKLRDKLLSLGWHKQFIPIGP